MIKKTEEENYQKFLTGVFLIKGWNARAKEIVQAVSDKDKAEIKQLLAELGEKIGREWAKDKSVRKIDTDMLRKWGGKLKEAVAMDPDYLVKQLKRLDYEVNNIVSKQS